MNRLNLIFEFVDTFQNQIERIDFDINRNEEEQIAGIIQLNQNANLEQMENFLNESKFNSVFDYWEIDKKKVIYRNGIIFFS